MLPGLLCSAHALHSNEPLGSLTSIYWVILPSALMRRPVGLQKYCSLDDGARRVRRLETPNVLLINWSGCGLVNTSWILVWCFKPTLEWRWLRPSVVFICICGNPDRSNWLYRSVSTFNLELMRCFVEILERQAGLRSGDTVRAYKNNNNEFRKIKIFEHIDNVSHTSVHQEFPLI